MKTVATVVASLLLSLGMLAAPAHAEGEQTPPEDCVPYGGTQNCVTPPEDCVPVGGSQSCDPPAEVCVPLTAWQSLVSAAQVSSQLSTDNAVLRSTVDTLRDDLARRAQTEQRLWDKLADETDRGDVLYVKNIRLQHKVTALRAKLRALRQSR